MRCTARHRLLLLAAFASSATLCGVGGCVIDDQGGARGASAAPAASIPDAGGPARRESAAKTLNDAETTPSSGDAEGDTLRTIPAPPPAQ